MNNNDLGAHFNEFESNFRRLREAGGDMTEDDAICLLLLGLPEDFKTIVSIMENQMEKLTLERVKATLRNETERKNVEEKKEVIERPAFHPGGNKSQVKCYRCGKLEH